MGITEFQKDLKDGLTLEEALTKHNLTFKEAVLACPRPKSQNKQSPKHDKNIARFVGRYVHQRGNFFHVMRTIQKKKSFFGSYNSIEDAEKVRDYLIEHGWTKDNMEKACKKFGIKRRT